MDTIKDRYRNDATFRMLVDVIRYHIRQHHTTPGELREALLFAAYIEEMENPTPTRWRLEGFAAELLDDVRHAETRRRPSDPEACVCPLPRTQCPACGKPCRACVLARVRALGPE
jgi:hypothetical protein